MFSKIDESGYSDFIYSGAAVVIVLSLLLLGFCLIGREKRKVTHNQWNFRHANVVSQSLCLRV